MTNSRGSLRHNITVRAESRVVAGRPQIQVLGYFMSMGPFHLLNTYIVPFIESTHVWYIVTKISYNGKMVADFDSIK